MIKKIIITLIIILVPVAFFMLQQGNEGYSITTKKDSLFNKKIERIIVIAQVEECLNPAFTHSFEYSMISAFQSNGVEAVFKVTSPESDSLMDYVKEAGIFAPDATMRINVKPLYYARDDGYQSIVGTDFEVSLIDMASEKRVWHAIGKVDYIDTSNPNYRANEDFLKTFAWHNTAAIVRTFIAEINNQKPAPFYTNSQERQRYGQRVD